MVNNKTKGKPWYSKGLKNSNKRKVKLYRKQLKDPSENNVRDYKLFRNLYNKLIRKAEENFYLEHFEEIKKDIKATWKSINEFIGRSKGTKNGIPREFFNDGVRTEGWEAISEGFNKYFTTVGVKLQKLIPPSNRNFKEYLGKPSLDRFEFREIGCESLLKIIKKLKNKNSHGQDLLTNKMIKYCFPGIIKTIVYLVNLSLNFGTVPLPLKNSRVVPIFKEGARSEYGNYRPISLISSFGKLVEKIVS